jgi:hypothetical protein
MIAVKAHFDGKVIVPDEPVHLPKDEPLLVHVEVVKEPKKKKGRESLHFSGWPRTRSRTTRCRPTCPIS